MNGELVVAVDCGGTNLRVALVESSGRIRNRMRRGTNAEAGMGQVAERIASLVREAAAGQPLRAVSLGVPGAIDHERGVITFSPNFADSEGFPMREAMERALSDLRVGVIVENDANAFALGEMWMGGGRGSRSMICLTLGTGVGGGIILGGRLWRGEDGTAGEIGHMVIDPDGYPCNCGSRGCLETFASATGIKRMAEEALADGEGGQLRSKAKGGEGVAPRLLQEMAEAGDETALQIWETMGRALGVGLTNLVNIFNPERVVIGGGVSRGWELFMPHAIAEMRSRAFALPADRVRVVRGELGDDAALLGAAYLAWNREEGA